MIRILTGPSSYLTSLSRGLHATDPQAEVGASALRPRWTGALLAFLLLEVLLVTAFRQPHQRFFRFAFFDSGGEFVRLHLWRQGDRPGIDFGYQYGLTLMLLQDAWYRIFGVTPRSFQELVLVSNLITAWGLWRIGKARQLGIAGLALFVVTIPEILGTASISTAHNLEPALLVHALAEQAMGRPARALLLATGCVFIKPTMAYVYGAILLGGLILANRGRPGPILRLCLPSALLALALTSWNLWVFGAGPVRNTLLPLEAGDVYRISGYGFFRGSGRQFWILPNAGLRDYFRYEVGYWLLGTLALIVGGAWALGRLASGREGGTSESARDHGLILSCALMHVLYVTCFFGNRASWVYYLAILIVGLAVLTDRNKWVVPVGLGLSLLVLVSDYSKARQTLREWSSLVRNDEFQDLWTKPDVYAEWRRVRELTRTGDPVLIAEYEGAAVIFPGFTRPCSYFDPGRTMPFNIRRKRRQVSEARWVVVSLSYDWLGKRLWRPAVEGSLEGSQVVWRGRHFAVYRRESPGSSAMIPRSPARID